MSVLFKNSQKIVDVVPRSVADLAQCVLEEEGASGRELSILFVDDAQMTRLNRRHLGRSKTTDVLAFPMTSGDATDLHPEIMGDVVVSAERAASYATQHGLPLDEELSLYVIHGILHLLGYDDLKIADARKMEDRQAELLAAARQRALIIKTKPASGRQRSGKKKYRRERK